MSSTTADYSVPTEVKCWWAPTEAAPLEPGTITRRAMTANDVVIAIKYAGICHSDIHVVGDCCDWETSFLVRSF